MSDAPDFFTTYADKFLSMAREADSLRDDLLAIGRNRDAAEMGARGATLREIVVILRVDGEGARAALTPKEPS